jgi:hypothetical protein
VHFCLSLTNDALYAERYRDRLTDMMNDMSLISELATMSRRPCVEEGSESDINKASLLSQSAIKLTNSNIADRHQGYIEALSNNDDGSDLQTDNMMEQLNSWEGIEEFSKQRERVSRVKTMSYNLNVSFAFSGISYAFVVSSQILL